MKVPLGHGLPLLDDIEEELTGYANHLLAFADEDVPLPHTIDLLEAASAYLARAYDIQRQICQREQRYKLGRGSAEQKFRTGTLESFISMAKVLRDLGSRRLSNAALLFESEKTGRD